MTAGLNRELVLVVTMNSLLVPCRLRVKPFFATLMATTVRSTPQLLLAVATVYVKARRQIQAALKTVSVVMGFAKLLKTFALVLPTAASQWMKPPLVAAPMASTMIVVSDCETQLNHVFNIAQQMV